MPRTTRSAVLVPLTVTAAVTVLLTAGCTTTVAGTAAPRAAELDAPRSSAASPRAQPGRPASSEAVTWVNDICGALLPFVATASTDPEIDPTDTEAAIESLSEYLGDAVSSLDGALSGMDAAGASPVEGGDEIVDRLGEALTTFRDSFANAKVDVDAVDSSDPQQLLEALPAAVAPLQELSSFPDPTVDLRNNAELDAAAQQAPSCRELSGNGG